MIYPDRMILGEWMRDPRLRKLGRHLQLLLLMLRHICDREGRFEYSPVDLHRALYASVEDNVSVRDVEAWLETLRSGGFVKSYTGSNGRRVGEMCREYWRQKLNFGKTLFEAEGEQPQLELGAPEPPAPKPRKRSEVKRSETGACAREVNRSMPPGLATPEFIAAWEAWLVHWAETFRRGAPMPLATADAHLKLLVPLGAARAIAALANATARGLREPAEPFAKNENHRPTAAGDTRRCALRNDYSGTF